jgi:putative sigma-54 modulation protein
MREGLGLGDDMQVEIRGRDIHVSQALRAHIERRLRFALDCFARRISKVRVKLEDLNGPRGGIDKCCQLAISLEPSSRIVVENRASNVYTAIDGVAAKAGCYIGRRLKRPHGRSPLTRIRELLLQDSQSVIGPADLQQGRA